MVKISNDKNCWKYVAKIIDFPRFQTFGHNLRIVSQKTQIIDFSKKTESKKKHKKSVKNYF